MTKYNVRYTGPSDFEVEADDFITAEDLAMDEASGYFRAERIEEEDDNG